MDSPTSTSGFGTGWRALYRAAIYETNKTQRQKRIAEAEQAILTRGRELLYERSAIDEREQLDDALYALRAYRSSSATQFQKAA